MKKSAIIMSVCLICGIFSTGIASAQILLKRDCPVIHYKVYLWTSDGGFSDITGDPQAIASYEQEATKEDGKCFKNVFWPRYLFSPHVQKESSKQPCNLTVTINYICGIPENPICWPTAGGTQCRP